jgi:hypothetical protein
MSFDPNKLPASVLQAFRQGPMMWPIVVEKALGSGIRDLNKLTDIVFYLHFPERIGNPIKPSEFQLIGKWKHFRALVKPRLDAAMMNRMDGFDVQELTQW